MKKPDRPRQPTSLAGLVEEVEACTVCAANQPHAPRPVLRVSSTARLLIVGQAPGRRVHETGIPWNDPSGDRLREWLGMTREQFYDVSRLTLLSGAYAQAYYLRTRRGRTLADTVHAWRDFLPDYFPLPHPSPRNRLWFKRHPWFEQDVLPALRERVGALRATGDNGGAHHPT